MMRLLLAPLERVPRNEIVSDFGGPCDMCATVCLSIEAHDFHDANVRNTLRHQNCLRSYQVRQLQRLVTRQ